MEEQDRIEQSLKDSSNQRKIKIIRMKPQSAKIKNTDCCSTGETSDSNSCCCGVEEPITKYNPNDHWIIGEIETKLGSIPRISTKLIFADRLGAWKVRWGIERMNYKINPGIYAVGNPDCNADVIVTANYKLTFDSLRKELTGLNLWILVLDTKGVNVWCAAGKGTFGTKELINRISKTKLSEIVSNRTLILPQLGAPGIVSHEVTKTTGFQIKYGPVRASDLKTYLSMGLVATKEMKEVKFTIRDRIVLTPVEIVAHVKKSMPLFGVMFLLNLVARNKFGLVDFYGYLGTLLAGCFLTPVLLPWIPGRAFALKGWLLGLLWTLSVLFLNGWPTSNDFELLRGIAYLLALPSVSAYFAMNFTGSSTYTSHSGVYKEMKTAIPMIITTISLGVVILLINCFIRL